MFGEKAINYAKQNWSNCIRIQPDMRYIKYSFVHPSNPYGIGRMYDIYVAINDDLIFDQQPMKKDYNDVSVLDDKICLITAEKILFDEINSNGEYSNSYNRTDNGKLLEQKMGEIHYFNGSGFPVSDKIYHFIKKNERMLRNTKNGRDFPDTPIVPDYDELVKNRE